MVFSSARGGISLQPVKWFSSKFELVTNPAGVERVNGFCTKDRWN